MIVHCVYHSSRSIIIRVNASSNLVSLALSFDGFRLALAAEWLKAGMR